MNTFSFSKLMRHGRYGNSMFQIASILGLADKFNAEAIFPEYKYDKYLLNPIPHGEMQKKVIEEKNCFYQRWDLKESCDLLGYFQSERYFYHIKDKIKEQFRYKPEFVEEIKNRLPAKDKEFILLQVRRDDYIGNPNYFNAPITYYIDSILTHFPEVSKYQFVVCSDEIPYCKVQFECLPHVYFTEGWSDVEQMCLYNFIDHFIIANSSFGWWQSWLGEKEHTKIIHPGHHLRGKLAEKNDQSAYWPDRWIRNQKDNYKIDLIDTTFTVPVFYDHPDRQHNLNLSTCILQKNFNTNIIVGEQGSKQFEYMGKYCKYHHFEGMTKFHRTKMLNEMAVMAETDYIVNWDCDVIIPPLQIYMAIQALRSGTDMVFPYGGIFARMERKWFREIERSLDIGIVGDTKFKGKRGIPLEPDSVGGAVMFNKESFIDGGMENEYMISFAPEDVERDYRFRKLGYKVERIGGCLYHLDHHVGLNSSPAHPLYKTNKEEWLKIKEMSKQELLDYVDRFPWRHKYTDKYYEDISKEAIESAREVYKVLEEIGFVIKGDGNYSVLDVGCGVGNWHNDNSNYNGIDYRVPERKLLIHKFRYDDIDLTSADLAEKGMPDLEDYKMDLCLCLEVAEHLPEVRAVSLVKALCNSSDKILFSAAIPMQGGKGHLNEQFQTYWEKLFKENGFGASRYNDDFRQSIVNNKNIALYYRQNMVLYEKGGTGKVEDFVHPEYYIEIVKHLKNQVV